MSCLNAIAYLLGSGGEPLVRLRLFSICMHAMDWGNQKCPRMDMLQRIHIFLPVIICWFEVLVEKEIKMIKGHLIGWEI